MKAGGPPPGNAKTGYHIWGYVGESSTLPAPNKTVVLLDGQTNEFAAHTDTNLLGKYDFAGLQPGTYRIKVDELEKEIVLSNENQRVDIDLGSTDSEMNYATGSAAAPEQEQEAPVEADEAPAKAQKGSAPPMANNSTLAQQIAGQYWGYSGSTESKIGLCPGGRYYDYSESSYSGQFSDGLGNQTGAWGAASQHEGAGTWSIQGTPQEGTISVVDQNGKSFTIQYRAGGEAGCFYFGGRQLCRAGACQ